MKPTPKLLLILSILTMLCLFSSGCANLQVGYTFNKDGSIILSHNVEVNSKMAEDEVQKSKEEDRQDGFTIMDNQHGYTATKVYKTISELVDKAPILNSNEYFNGVQVKRGLLYDYYSFDLFKKGEHINIPQNTYHANIPSFFSPDIKMNIWEYMDYQREAETETRQLNDLNNQLTDAAINSMKIQFVWTLPYSADSSNADIKSNDNKTLSWDVKPNLLNNKDLFIQMKFKIYHKKTIIALIIIGVLILVTAIVLLILGLLNWHKKRTTFLSIAAILMLVLIGGLIGSKYNIAKPPNLTMDNRIVSKTAKDSNGNSLIETIKKIKAMPLNDLSKAKKTLTNKKIKADITAVSTTDNDGFLALGTLNTKLYFIAYDAKSDRVGLIPYNENLLNYRLNYTSITDNKKIYRPMQFLLELWDGNIGKDKGLGDEDDQRRTLPINIFFKVDADNNIIISDPITSGEGLNPSHYHTKLREPKNEELAKIIPMHIDSLRVDIKARNIILPRG